MLEQNRYELQGAWTHKCIIYTSGSCGYNMFAMVCMSAWCWYYYIINVQSITKFIIISATCYTPLVHYTFYLFGYVRAWP